VAGHSPGLNPIENVWAWMKNQLADSNCKNMDEWKREITRLWVTKMDDCQYLKNLVESMPRRLQ
jgi:transposase